MKNHLNKDFTKSSFAATVKSNDYVRNDRSAYDLNKTGHYTTSSNKNSTRHLDLKK
jgi:hypothetical protein